MSISGDRYLLCRAGPHTLAIAMECVRQIGAGARADSKIDLRRLLKISAAEEGVAIAMQIDDAEIVVIVDSVLQIETIAGSEFRRLPPIFDEANAVFDRACRREIGGGHPLRLRLQALAAPL